MDTELAPEMMDLAIIHCTALVRTDGGRAHFAPDATITVKAGRFVAIDQNPAGAPRAREVIDARGMVAMSGLINTHCHAAMTLLRGSAEDVSVGAWFNDYIWPMEVNVGERDVYLGTLLARNIRAITSRAGAACRNRPSGTSKSSCRPRLRL